MSDNKYFSYGGRPINILRLIDVVNYNKNRFAEELELNEELSATVNRYVDEILLDIKSGNVYGSEKGYGGFTNTQGRNSEEFSQALFLVNSVIDKFSHPSLLSKTVKAIDSTATTVGLIQRLIPTWLKDVKEQGVDKYFTDLLTNYKNDYNITDPDLDTLISKVQNGIQLDDLQLFKKFGFEQGALNFMLSDFIDNSQTTETNNTEVTNDDSEQSTQTDDYYKQAHEWDEADILRLTGIAADITAALYPGPIGSLIAGATSTAFYTTADIMQNRPTSDIIEDTFVNSLLSLVGVIPLFGDVLGNGTKIVKTLTLLTPKIISYIGYAATAKGAAEAVPGIVKSISKVGKDGKENELTMQDWHNILNGVKLTLDGLNIARSGNALSKANKLVKINRNNEKILIPVKHHGKSKQLLLIEPEDVNYIKSNIKNPSNIENYIGKKYPSYENITVSTKPEQAWFNPKRYLDPSYQVSTAPGINKEKILETVENLKPNSILNPKYKRTSDLLDRKMKQVEVPKVPKAPTIPDESPITIDKEGGVLKYYNGGNPKNPNAGNWYSEIGKHFLLDLANALKLATVSMDDVNNMQTSHYNLSVKHPNQNELTKDTDVTKYQQAIINKYNYLNSKGITNGEIIKRWKVNINHHDKDNSKRGFIADGLFGGKTLDRTLLGRRDDYTEDDLKSTQKIFNDIGYEMFLDPNNNYYYLRKSEKPLQTPAPPDQQNDEIVTDTPDQIVTPDQIDVPKEQPIMTKILPFSVLNYLRALSHNKKLLNIFKENPLLQKITHEFNRNLYGDLRAIFNGYNTAADIINRIPLTTDMDKNIAYLFESFNLGNKYKQLAYAQDDLIRRQTQEQSIQLQKENIKNRVDNANVNALLIYQHLREHLYAKMNRDRSDYQSGTNLVNEIKLLVYQHNLLKSQKDKAVYTHMISLDIEKNPSKYISGWTEEHTNLLNRYKTGDPTLTNTDRYKIDLLLKLLQEVIMLKLNPEYKWNTISVKNGAKLNLNKIKNLINK